MKPTQSTVLIYDDISRLVAAIPQLSIYSHPHTKRIISSESLQLLILISYFCALRITETLKLTKSDFNLEKKELHSYSLGKFSPNITTIPPILIEKLEKYLSKLNENDPLFKITRQTVWTHFKDAGKLATLNLFTSQKRRDIEGVFTRLLRQSYEIFMRQENANKNLIDLKLRNRSQSNYDNYNINDLKRWEETISYNKHYGAVVFIDALGTKGSWQLTKHNPIFQNWEKLTFDIKSLFKNKEKKH